MKKTIVFGSAVSILALTILFSISSVYADDIIDQINIEVPVSCTLSGTNLLHSATIRNEQYKEDIGSANIKTTCNDTSGYAIYAIGYTNEEYGNNQMIDNNLGSTYGINTGKYVSGTTTDSVWSMKLTPVSGTYAPNIRNDSTYNYTNYEVIPDTYTRVVSLDSATDFGDGSIGSNFTTSYAVYASATQPAGTYQGKVKFTLVHPSDAPAPYVPHEIECEAGKICYNTNTGPTETLGEMGKQTASSNTSVTLWASNFKRDGYGFAGWNDAFDYSGNFYGPNETITTPADTSTNGLSLYAVWVPSAGTLQNWSGCSSLAQGSVTALTDARDNDTYAVAKLADGKCWMIENLRLADKDSSNNDINLSSTNTHNPSLPLNSSWYYKDKQDTLTTFNHLSATTDPTITAWCTAYSSNCIDQSMLEANNTMLFVNNTASNYSTGSNVYSYGNYYNWYSTTAGHGKYNSGSSGYIASGDICPAGWHLPKGGDKNNTSDNEFWQLGVALTGKKPANTPSQDRPYYTGTPEGTNASQVFRSYPNNFLYSGYVFDSSVIDRSLNGNYWSSVQRSYEGAYFLDFYGHYVYPGTGNGSKYVGGMVRCVSGV